MADESYLLGLAVGASEDLAAIRGQLSGLGDFQASVLEFMAPDAAEVSLAAPEPDGMACAVGALEGAPDGFFSDLMALEYVQTVTGLVVLAVLALSLGVQLFQSFAHLWRS